MTVAELIAELRKMPQDAEATVSVAGPKDTAFTDDITVRHYDGKVDVSGWAASDNDNAYFPSDC